MADCECLNDCHYFKTVLLREVEAMAEMRRRKYCKGDYTLCARYMVFKALGNENVPLDLLPSEVQKAKELIDKVKEDKNSR
jgi:hypothetical protein